MDMDKVKNCFANFLDDEQALFQKNERELDYFLENFNENRMSEAENQKENTRVIKKGF
jgi:hypothetical protein